MSYEVELKFPVADTTRSLIHLLNLGAVHDGKTVQRDTYFSHPQRSFAQTNEALRLREVDDKNFITYKGPLVDHQTKMRREIEISLQSGKLAGQEFSEMLKILGFRPVKTVVKIRDSYRINWQDRHCEVCIDQVEHLGTFIEVETIAEEAALDDAKQTVLKLASLLDLQNPEPRSYLNMLLELQQGKGSAQK